MRNPPAATPFGSSPRLRAARAHRRIRVGMVAISAAILPVVAVAWWLAPGNVAAVVVPLVGAVAGWLALGVALFRFRCPSCGRPMHRGGPFGLDLYGTACVNCGLELGRRDR
jgi:hypothetical protein